MADFTIQTTLYPDGTLVAAYSGAVNPPGRSGSPLGDAIDSETIASHQATFTGLVEGTEYAVAGEVGGSWRWMRFTTESPSDDPITEQELEDRLAELEFITQADAQELIDDSIEASEATMTALIEGPPTTNVQTGTTYTPVAGDELNVIVELTNNSEVLVTLPSGVFANNAQIEFCALGTAGATFEAGPGASLDSAGGLVDLAQSTTAVARHRGGNEWLLTGALA